MAGGIYFELIENKAGALTKLISTRVLFCFTFLPHTKYNVHQKSHYQLPIK